MDLNPNIDKEAEKNITDQEVLAAALEPLCSQPPRSERLALDC